MSVKLLLFIIFVLTLMIVLMIFIVNYPYRKNTSIPVRPMWQTTSFPPIIDNVTVVLYGSKIMENSLQLFKIKGLILVETGDHVRDRIINKHLSEKNIFACQQELIDAGYEDIAKL